MIDRRLIGAVQGGLPLVPRPYQSIGEKIGLTESEVIARIKQLIDSGVFKRFGIVVRHHELGYRANAMVVWNVPDQYVAQYGRRMSSYPFVSLCYRRPRVLPAWPYNLFCMIHGQDRDDYSSRRLA
jgi:DNA-binding Lrp family transcriptional regulator